MSIGPGRYLIQPLDSHDRFVGGPPALPGPPTPLLIVPDHMKKVFEVMPAGGDRFMMMTQGGSVGHDRGNNVTTNPFGEEPVQWAIDHGSHPGSFNIKLPNSDKCWTVLNMDDHTPIRLEGANGSPAQEWKLIRFEE